MRSLLCRFWLLVPLLLLFVQGSSGLRAEVGGLAAATTSYLPAEASGSERRAADEAATVESDDDGESGAERDGDVGTERSELDHASSAADSQPALLLRWRHRRVDGGLAALLFRRVALPLRGPPSVRDGKS